jgi:hypothetical protein
MRPHYSVILSSLLVGGLTLLSPVIGYAQKPTIAPVPQWVKSYSISSDISTNKDLDEGVVRLFHEKQWNVGLSSFYTHALLDIKTEAGVQKASQVSIEFDPTYQRVVYHYIHILRGGKIINGLDVNKVKILHQEEDMDLSIYNGALKALIILEDIRKGDRIEYAYSLIGRNPVFGSRFFGELETGFSVPVKHLRYRVLMPSGRVLHFRKKGGAPDPALSTEKGNTVYEWSMEDLPAVQGEDHMPGWYDPYGWISLSEYGSWKEVNDWACTLFAVNQIPEGGLAAKIAQISASSSDPEQRILKALRFVQDDIRYMGIEMGPNSHQPHDPSKVFAQRFGDCKDKSLLLCTMLRALGVQAYPVLINTDEKDRLNQELPSPNDFDHATVKVVLEDKSYWLDPTIAFQRGRLKDLSFPDFECGLVLSDTTQSLSPIPLQGESVTDVSEVVTMDNLSGPGRLEVTTKFKGSYADDLRSDINTSSLSEIQKNYLKFYNDFYKGVKVADSLKVEDVAPDGSMVTHESYTIGQLWVKREMGIKASFNALSVSSILPDIKDKTRETPFEIRYPEHYKERLEIRLPEAWKFSQEDKDINTSQFTFHTSESSTPTTVDLTYEYKALQDNVPADMIRETDSTLDKIQDELGYELSQNLTASDGPSETPDTPSSDHPNMDRLEAVILAGLVGLLIYMYRKRNSAS